VIKIIDGKRWSSVGNLYELLKLDDSVMYSDLIDDVGEAIKQWKFRQDLNPDTVNKFSELIDEL